MQTVTWSDNFAVGSIGTGEVCNSYEAYRATLAGIDQTSVVSIRLYGSLDGTGKICNDPIQAGRIVEGLKSGTFALALCNGEDWIVGRCGGGMEIAVGEPYLCTCSVLYSIRPCIGNRNWGAIGANVCGGPTQTMSIDVEYTL